MKTYRKRYINQIKNYRRHYIHLVIFTIIAIAACIYIHIPQCFFPSAYESYLTADDIYNNGTHYVKCHADTLYYTGYDYTRGASTKGYYYYSLENDLCTFYLISKDTVGESPMLTLYDVYFTGVLVNNSSSLNSLRKYLADDLNWNVTGMQKFSSNIIISECNYNIILYVLTASYVLFVLISDIEFIIFLIIKKKLFSKNKS